MNSKQRNLPRNVSHVRFFKYLDIYGILFMIFPTIFCLVFISKMVASGLVMGGKSGMMLSILLILINIAIYASCFLLVAILDDQLRGIERLLLIIKFKRSKNRVLNGNENEDFIIDKKKLKEESSKC